MDNVWADVQQAQMTREGVRENSARRVSQFLTYETEGSGELIPRRVLRFEVPFFSEPAVSTGHSLRRRPDPKIYRLPLVTAGVLRWDRDDRGFYRGAFLYFSIFCRVQPDYTVTEQTPAAKPFIIHSLTFTGEGFKAMSSEVNEGLVDDRVRPLRPPS